MVTHLRSKLKRFGFDLTTEDDVDLLHDLLFECGRPEPEELETMLEQFRNEKEKRQVHKAVFPFTIKSILNEEASL
jgi:hypothetical protein